MKMPHIPLEKSEKERHCEKSHHKSGDAYQTNFRFWAGESTEINSGKCRLFSVFSVGWQSFFIAKNRKEMCKMKKVTSLLLSLIVLISAVFPLTAFAETKKEAFISQVNEDIADEIAYLNITPSLDTVVDTYTLFRVDQSKKADFLALLDENLSSNGGKIISNGKEDIVAYGAVINILCILGEDVENYKGYDIKSMFENLADKSVSNPYYYRIVTEASKNINNDILGHAFVDEFINNYYTLGQGMDYWGISCDNTAMFLAGIAPYKEDYSEYVDDAKKIVESYTTENGCFYSTEYTDISPDSTAVAILGYAAIGEHKTAKKLYDCLMNGFESPDNNGVIMAWGTENAYTTKETLMALGYFEPTLAFDDIQNDEDLPQNEDDSQSFEYTEEITETINNEPSEKVIKSPETGAGVTVGFAAMSIGFALLIGSKRKEN